MCLRLSIVFLVSLVSLIGYTQNGREEIHTMADRFYLQRDGRFFYLTPGGRVSDEIIPNRVVVKPIEDLPLNQVLLNELGFSDVYLRPEKIADGYYILDIPGPKGARLKRV